MNSEDGDNKMWQDGEICIIGGSLLFFSPDTNPDFMFLHFEFCVTYTLFYGHS